MSQTILVTGGLGYVGARLVPHLLEAGYAVKIIDLGLYGREALDHLDGRPVSFIEGDIRDPDAVRQAMEGVDAVIHLAAISNDPTGEIDEVITRQVNYDAVGLLLALAKEAGVKRFINASSSSVFGIKDETDVTEALEPEPITHYSRYKMLSEWMVITASASDFVTVNIRPATICGDSPRQRFDLTVNKLTADAIRKGVISVHGGQQRRPNVGMTDIINLYQRLLEWDADAINGRTFNFGFENHKIIHIAELIRDELSDLDIKIDITKTYDHRDYHISSTKILDTLGYEPVSSIAKEVANLRTALDRYPDIDDPKHHNIKSMQLERNNAAYRYLSR